MPAKKKTTKRTTAKRTTKKDVAKVDLVKIKKPVAPKEVERGSDDDKRLSQFTGYSYEQRALIKRMYGEFLTDAHIAELGQMSKATGLDTFTRDIYPIRDESGNVVIFSPRDGLRKLAKQNPEYVIHNSVEVREGDNFKWATINNVVGVAEHSFSPAQDRVKKPILGSYTVATMRKDGELFYIVEWADFATYNKGKNGWDTHEAEMIKKVSEAHALRKVANVKLYIEEEFNIKRDDQGNAYIGETVDVEDEAYSEAVEMVESSKNLEELSSASEFIGRIKLKGKQKKDIANLFIEKQRALSVTDKPNE